MIITVNRYRSDSQKNLQKVQISRQFNIYDLLANNNYKNNISNNINNINNININNNNNNNNNINNRYIIQPQKF